MLVRQGDPGNLLRFPIRLIYPNVPRIFRRAGRLHPAALTCEEALFREHPTR